MTGSEKNGRGGDKPLERYVRLLEVISGFPEGISPSAIAEVLSLPKATAYRLIRSLAEVGLVEMTAPPSAACRLGDRLERLLFAGTSDGWLKIIARPILEDLAEKTGEACFMARFGGGVVRSIEMVAPDTRLRAYIVPGHEISLNAGASAKAILAFQPKTVLDSVLAQPFQTFTSATKTDPDEIRAELMTVRETGIAYCVEEDVEGFAAIAVPVLVDGVDVQNSICVTGTVKSLIEKKKSLIESELLTHSISIAKALNRRYERYIWQHNYDYK